MSLIPSFFREGQKYLAKVSGLCADKDFYTLVVAGNFITAYSQSELVPGETVYLEVVKAGNQPQLKIIRQEVKVSAAEKLLISCSLANTPRNLLLLEQYLAEGRPVQLGEILKYIREQK